MQAHKDPAILDRRLAKPPHSFPSPTHNTHTTNHTAPPAMPYRKLGRTSSHRWAMLRNMVTSLVEHERIRTTTAKVSQAEGWREGGRQRDCVYTVGTRPWTPRSVDGQGEGEWAGPERAGLMCLVQHLRVGPTTTHCLLARSRFTRLPWGWWVSAYIWKGASCGLHPIASTLSNSMRKTDPPLPCKALWAKRSKGGRRVHVCACSPILARLMFTMLCFWGC